MSSSLVDKPQNLHRGWSVECIREPSCFVTDSCTPIRCSMCNDGVCANGSCLKRSQLCNLKADCQDGEDEMGCDDIGFRLTNGSESAGNLEVFFHGHWEPICAHGLGYDTANEICKNMQMGPSTILNPIELYAHAWNIRCSERCSLKGFKNCDKQAHIQCGIGTGAILGKCGIRQVETVARDPRHVRLARVVGGFETKAGGFPWTAAIKIKATGAHHCGASILDRTHLITAAHCFEEDRRPRSYTVVVGDWDNNVVEGHEQIFNITRFYLYPLYEDLFSHDIAIIEIGRPAILFDDWAQPICLPPRDFSYQTGRKCVVSGWGSMGLKYPTRLQAALLPIIDRAECINSSRIYASMSRSAFCAGYLEGGVDSCQGDSGGPLACPNEDGVYVLAGVISWGDGCAQKNQPGIYTMVAPYLSWIENILKSHRQ